MRTIQVSTDVYAAIWRDRKQGEDSEDAILARRFEIARPASKEPAERDLTVTLGFHDPRFGVALEPGFEVSRTFKGQQYTARAIQGFWILSSTGLGYPSLNELSRAIGAGTENAWQAWYYVDRKTGRRRPMSDLRDPSKIIKRHRSEITLEELGL